MLGCLLTKHLPKDRNDSKLTNNIKKKQQTQQKSSLDIHKNIFFSYTFVCMCFITVITQKKSPKIIITTSHT